MRESCLLRDCWEYGINTLNELNLGALNSCVHNDVNQSKHKKRTNNHAIYI
jgi:hypothetical protein